LLNETYAEHLAQEIPAVSQGLVVNACFPGPAGCQEERQGHPGLRTPIAAKEACGRRRVTDHGGVAFLPKGRPEAEQVYGFQEVCLSLAVFPDQEDFTGTQDKLGVLEVSKVEEP
jgi:hypothetical protein